MSTDSKPQQYEQFFRYTTRRWPWDEEKELRERYMKFNVEELKRIAAEVVRQLSSLRSLPRRLGVLPRLIGVVFSEDVKDIVISWLVRTVIINAFHAAFCSLRV